MGLRKALKRRTPHYPRYKTEDEPGWQPGRRTVAKRRARRYPRKWDRPT